MRALAVKWILGKSTFGENDTQKSIIFFLFVITHAPVSVGLLYKIMEKTFSSSTQELTSIMLHPDEFIDQ